MISTKREISTDPFLHTGVAVFHLAKLRMLQFYYTFIDQYSDRSDFVLCKMDTESNTLHFQ